MNTSPHLSCFYVSALYFNFILQLLASLYWVTCLHRTFVFQFQAVEDLNKILLKRVTSPRPIMVANFQDHQVTREIFQIKSISRMINLSDGGVGVKPPTLGKKVLTSQGVQSEGSTNGVAPKQTMLQKFKSNLPSSPRQVGLGKRTSSSSGFSSARSDRSESSVSVSSDTNFPSPSALRRIQENEHIKHMTDNTPAKQNLR